jgi:hypothetical protein
MDGDFENSPRTMEIAMVNWPEMLPHAEDWANGFWTGAGTVSLLAIFAAAVALISHAI